VFEASKISRRRGSTIEYRTRDYVVLLHKCKVRLQNRCTVPNTEGGFIMLSLNYSPEFREMITSVRNRHQSTTPSEDSHNFFESLVQR